MLSSDGQVEPTIEEPSAVVGTDDAIRVRAARLADDRAIVFRIDPDAAPAAGRRTLPDLPGEEYEGDAVSVRVDDDVAEIEFVVVVAGEPIVEVIPGTAIREDDRWMLRADSFCRLIATGGIECPADLARPG